MKSCIICCHDGSLTTTESEATASCLMPENMSPGNFVKYERTLVKYFQFGELYITSVASVPTSVDSTLLIP